MDIGRILASGALVCGAAALIRGSLRAAFSPAGRGRTFGEICMAAGLVLWGLQAVAQSRVIVDDLRVAGIVALLAGAGVLRLTLHRAAMPGSVRER